jgi:hypothetical protein
MRCCRRAASRIGLWRKFWRVGSRIAVLGECIFHFGACSAVDRVFSSEYDLAP